MESSVQQVRGKIIRWVDQSHWGVANYYIHGEAGPRKVFVHVSKVVSDEKPQMGSRIAFNVGPARSASELPAALNVEVIFTPAVQ
jgi:cold shock CspA family protein